MAMRRLFVVALATFLFVAARADDRSRTSPEGGAVTPDGVGSAPTPSAGGGKKKASQRAAAKPRALPPPPAPKGGARQEKPKPCEEIRPCPID
jgi:hypothetical protein